MTTEETRAMQVDALDKLSDILMTENERLSADYEDFIGVAARRIERLERSLEWALRALGNPPEFSGSLADWEEAKAAVLDQKVVTDGP